MWPKRVSNPGPLTLEPDALPTALHVHAPQFLYDEVTCIGALSGKQLHHFHVLLSFLMGASSSKNKITPKGEKNYSRLSLSRSQRDPLNTSRYPYFDISDV